MLRKLLLLLLIGFAFTEINGQSYLTYRSTGACGTQSYVFVESGTAGGKVRYASTNDVPTLMLWNSNSIPTPDPTAITILEIVWDNALLRWNFQVNGGTNIIFINSDDTPTIPFTTWSDGPSTTCVAGDEMEAYDEVVLPVNREEFSDIKIYPNPSTGFINISNLKENSRVVISNITGQVVKDIVVGVNDNRIDIQDLVQGFYFVSLEGKKTIKLLKR